MARLAFAARNSCSRSSFVMLDSPPGEDRALMPLRFCSASSLIRRAGPCNGGGRAPHGKRGKPWSRPVSLLLRPRAKRGGKQSPSWCALPGGDCRVASLLAMTAGWVSCAFPRFSRLPRGSDYRVLSAPAGRGMVTNALAGGGCSDETARDVSPGWCRGGGGGAATVCHWSIDGGNHAEIRTAGKSDLARSDLDDGVGDGEPCLRGLRHVVCGELKIGAEAADGRRPHRVGRWPHLPDQAAGGTE